MELRGWRGGGGAYDETIVLELNFGRKKIFFTVLYRSPTFKFGSPKDTLSTFRTLHSRI